MNAVKRTQGFFLEEKKNKTNGKDLDVDIDIDIGTEMLEICRMAREFFMGEIYLMKNYGLSECLYIYIYIISPSLRSWVLN